LRSVLASVILLVLAAATVVPIMAGANLAGTAFGVPAITQTGTTTSFSRDTAAATDNEAFSLSFPAGTGSFFGPLDGVPAGSTFGVSTPSIAVPFGQANENVVSGFPATGFSFPAFGFGL